MLIILINCPCPADYCAENDHIAHADRADYANNAWLDNHSAKSLLMFVRCPLVLIFKLVWKVRQFWHLGAVWLFVHLHFAGSAVSYKLT